MRRHGRDLLFLLLVAAGLVLYLARPQRPAQWAAAARWWGSLLPYRGLEDGAAWFQGEPALRPPADYSQSAMGPLAVFGGQLEYLGADTAATLGPGDEVHVWLITYWRCPASGCGYRVRYRWGESGAGMVLATHDLEGPGAGRAGDLAVDRLLLPAEAWARGIVGVEVEGPQRTLEVVSVSLAVQGTTHLWIWQK